MKTRLFLTLLLAAIVSLPLNAKTVFTISGPESSYNQIRVVNETSYDTVRCRLVVLKEDDSADWVYGVYDLQGKGDTDTHTNSILRSARLAIELPKDFEGELSYSLDYLDLPLFDIVVVHLYDKKSEFNEE